MRMAPPKQGHRSAGAGATTGHIHTLTVVDSGPKIKSPLGAGYESARQGAEVAKAIFRAAPPAHQFSEA
jgi:hypothetical protein